MSPAVFWFIVVVVVYIAFQRGTNRNKELTIKLNMLQDKYNARNKQCSKLLEKNEGLTAQLTKARTAMFKMQRGLSKFRAMSNLAKTELVVITKERNDLQAQVDELTKRPPSFLMN